MKLPNLNLQRWLSPASPHLATSSAGHDRAGTSHFSSRSGGNGGGGDDDYGFEDDETFTSETPPESSRSTRGGGSGSGGNRGNGSGGRQRTIQFQPEDRYWTEYLRIALPIIGLILMLGLFWFWATKIIGDDTNTNDPQPTQDPGQVTTIAADPTETPGATLETAVVNTPEPTQGGAEPSATSETSDDGDAETPDDEETPADDPTTEPDDTETAEFEEGDLVVTTEEGVNFRDAASTDGEVIRILDVGEEVTVLGPPEEDGDITWYNVVDSDGEEGWVSGEFLELAAE